MGCLCSNDSTSVVKPLQRSTSAFSTSSIDLHPPLFFQTHERNIYADYKIEKEIIGYGARGEIRLCTNNSSGKKFAVKIVNKAQLPPEVVKGKLVKKQVDMLSTLNHPSILKIYDFYEDPSNYFILMDYVKGGDLFEKIKHTQYFSEEMAARIMKQIFSCLAHMHSYSIAHRDIKPENILIEETAKNIVVKIIDFDTAANFSGKKFKDQQGSIYYMSPDVLKGDYAEKCDVWSAGIILYTLLTNSFPFFSEDRLDTEQLILSAKLDIEYLKSIGISSEAIDLLRKVLNPLPDQRFSAAEASHHGWILKYSYKPLTRPIQEELYNVLSHGLKLWSLKCVIPPFEFNKYHLAFVQSDRNADGFVARDEMLEYIGNEQEVDEIMENGYWKQKGELDFYEFMSVMADKNIFIKYQQEIISEIECIRHGCSLTIELVKFLSDKLKDGTRFKELADLPLKLSIEDIIKILLI